MENLASGLSIQHAAKTASKVPDAPNDGTFDLVVILKK